MNISTLKRVLWMTVSALMIVSFITACSEQPYDDGVFRDVALAKHVRLLLGLAEQEEMDTLKLKEFTALKLDNMGIKDLTGLEHFTNLQNLDLGSNQISDLSPLADLIALESLRLDENKISDVSPLTGLVSLKYLDLDRNVIADVAPLASLVNLENLFLAYNKITDGTPLKHLSAYDSINWLGNKTDMEGNPR